MMEYFNHLPEEITLDILSRVVPTESVLECKSVCTSWRSLLRRPSFSKMHLHHLNHHDSSKFGFIALTFVDRIHTKNENLQYFEYNDTHDDESTTPIGRITRFNFTLPFGEDTCFFSSCNGLICLTPSRYSVEISCICNPITREYIMLSEINRVGMDHRTSGFGYVSSTNEYKVVRIMFDNKTDVLEVLIYTLGSGHGWRNLGKFNFGNGLHWGSGVLVNGVLYWLDYGLDMIFTFDLAKEKFCERLSLPSLPDEDAGDEYELGVLDGCLSFSINARVDGDLCWDVWLLNDNDVMKEGKEHHSMGWSEEFRVYDNQPFAVTKSYNVLTFTYSGHHINVQDPEASTSERIVDFKELFAGVVPHKNTLISLKELGEEETKILESLDIADTESHD